MWCGSVARLLARALHVDQRELLTHARELPLLTLLGEPVLRRAQHLHHARAVPQQREWWVVVVHAAHRGRRAGIAGRGALCVRGGGGRRGRTAAVTESSYWSSSAAGRRPPGSVIASGLVPGARLGARSTSSPGLISVYISFDIRRPVKGAPPSLLGAEPGRSCRP